VFLGNEVGKRFVIPKDDDIWSENQFVS